MTGRWRVTKNQGQWKRGKANHNAAAAGSSDGGGARAEQEGQSKDLLAPNVGAGSKSSSEVPLKCEKVDLNLKLTD